MSIQALILDIGGVLVRTEDWSPRQQWERKLGLPANSLEPLVHGTVSNESYERGKLSFDAFWNAVARKLHIPASQMAQFRDDFYSGDRLNLPLIEFVRAQRERGIKTGIISNAPPSMRLMITHKFPIIDDFDAVILSGEAGVRKPERRVYDIACNALHVLPEEGVFVDDLEVNITGARAAGMQAVHFVDTEPALVELRRWLGSAA